MRNILLMINRNLTKQQYKNKNHQSTYVKKHNIPSEEEQDESFSLDQRDSKTLQQQSYTFENDQNDQNQPDINPNYKNQPKEPPSHIFNNFGQIKKCIYLLQTIIPEFFTDQLIDIIYQRAKNYKYLNIQQENIKKTAIKQDIKNGTYLNKDNETPIYRNSVNNNDTIQLSSNSTDNPPNNLLDNQIQTKLFKEQILAAKSFCNRNYGYNNITKKCNFKTLYSNEKQRKNLIQALKQCRKNFRPLICLLIFQFIKKLYKFQDDSFEFDKDMIKRINDAIQNYLDEKNKDFQFLKAKNIDEEEIKKSISQKKNQIIKKKATQKPHKEDVKAPIEQKNQQYKQSQFLKKGYKKKKVPFKLRLIWDQQFQKQFLQIIKKTNSFGQIRDHFQSLYPKHYNIISIDSLRNQFCRILRLSIRKLDYCWSNFKDRLPQLCKLEEKRAKMIISGRQGRSVRLQLLQFYALKNIDAIILTKTINSVNNFIKALEKMEKGQSRRVKLKECIATQNSIAENSMTSMSEKEGSQHNMPTDGYQYSSSGSQFV